ncbi:MAG: hypothetical protein KAH38_09495, partial [Candidatus Hydrogenedentes bacterium]|nr:hypothetical protein [Candidatus Hydrogenedentota bacterium]
AVKKPAVKKPAVAVKKETVAKTKIAKKTMVPEVEVPNSEALKKANRVRDERNSEFSELMASLSKPLEPDTDEK